MIDHNLKCIFIHIPVTGGSVIEKSLTGIDWQHVDPRTKHMDCELSKIYYAKNWEEYKKFSIVRNPWDWFVSMYSKTRPKELEGISFENYIKMYSKFQYMSWEYPLNRIQLPFYPSVKEVDHIWFFENLVETFSDICEFIGVEREFCQTRLHSNLREKDYRPYYNDKTKDLVAKLFKEDLEVFQYEF